MEEPVFLQIQALSSNQENGKDSYTEVQCLCIYSFELGLKHLDKGHNPKHTFL